MFNERYTVRDFMLDMLLCVIGSAAVSVQVAVFTAPNQIVPGGVSGLSTTLAYITPVRVGLWIIILNVPLICAAWRLMGIRSLVCTLVNVMLTGVMVDWFSVILPHYTNDLMLASICAGVCGGAGVGLLFRRGLSTGGTDLLALILNHFFPDMPAGVLLMMIDAGVVLTAVLVFRNIEVALYSMIIVFVGSRVIDAISIGMDHAKVVYTISRHAGEISDAICAMDRGVTLIPAVGGYTGDSKNLLICVTKRFMLTRILRTIKYIDPKAFTYVVDSTEVHGEGYKE